jgi:hypothetical protein
MEKKIEGQVCSLLLTSGGRRNRLVSVDVMPSRIACHIFAHAMCLIFAVILV